MPPAKPKSPSAVNAVNYLMQKYIADHPERELMLCEEAENSRIAETIYNMRQDAGLSQSELAKRIGTQKSAISRLEDADYEGHSLGMLRRIADALGYRMTLAFSKNDEPAKNRIGKKATTYKMETNPAKAFVVKEGADRPGKAKAHPKNAKR